MMLQMLMGGSSKTAFLSNFSVTATSAAGQACDGSFTVDNDGTLDKNEEGAISEVLTWLNLGDPSDFEVMLTKNSGTDPDTGSLLTWLGCGTDRSWSWTRAAVGTLSFGGTLDIRRADNQVVVATCTVTVSLTRPS